MIEPIQYGSDGYEGDGVGGELVIPRGGAAVDFDPAEEVFDRVAMAVERFAEFVSDLAVAAWRNAGGGVGPDEVLAESRRIKAFVGDDDFAQELLADKRGGLNIPDWTGDQIKGQGPAHAVNHRDDFAVEASLCHSHGLTCLAPCGIGAIAMDLDEGAVEAADPARRLRADERQHTVPYASLAPSSEPRVDRAPRSKMGGQVPPGAARAQQIDDSFDDPAIIFRWPTAAASPSDTSSASLIRSIFLAAPRAVPVTRIDLE